MQTEFVHLNGELLGSPEGATIGWIHVLAFDKRQISHGLVAPALFFILMLGPLGFTLYLALRTLKERGQASTA